MEKDLNDSDFQNSSISRDNENEQSLVGKFKKNVSEIISNTPLSKWFKKTGDTPSSSLRKRQDDSDDETDIQEFQPPTKRTKLPPSKETISLNVSQVLSPISKVNDIKKPSYSNFPEPIPGPSGYQTRKMLSSTSFTLENNYKTAKDNEQPNSNVFKNPRSMVSDRLGASNINKEVNISDSEESTSGYSSGRIGSKEIVSQESSKQTSPLENSPVKARSLFQHSSTGRSLFSDRTFSPHRNSTLSSRMPSFNPSNVGSSNFVDRTLSTKKILNSPFYSGRTIYGGASAYGKSSGRTPQDLKKVLRQTVNIKPINRDLEKGDFQLGKTARRILDTLEQYSSPVSDAKKIPITSKKLKSEGSLTKYIGANPYTLRGSRSASNKELQVPSVTDLLKMKLDQQKTRLQDSTEAVRQIATKSKSVLNETSYQLAIHNDKEKHTGKMKTKITSVRQKTQLEETVPKLNLNPVALPIEEIPKFDFVVLPPSSTVSSGNKTTEKSPKLTGLFTANKTPIPKVSEEGTPKTSETIYKHKTVEEKTKENTRKESTMEFKFSAPLVLAECLKPIKALNNFKFSEPLVKKRKSIHSEPNNKENGVSDLIKIKKNNGENVSNLTNTTDRKQKTSTNNGSISLMDKFKPKEGTWECSVCMIRNQGDKSICAACETPRSLLDKTVITDPKPSFIQSSSTKSTIPTSSFGSKFKAPSNTWECPTCMIRNNEDITKCVACETSKPGSASTKANTTFNLSSSAAPSFGSKFAPPPSTWECPTCMIRNKEELVKCVACETLKPGAKNQTTSSFSVEFKKKDDEWECEVCMVRNKASASKCQCCESAKPGASLSSIAQSSNGSKTSKFNFGIDKATASSFTFGIPPAAQATQSTSKTNASLVFGQSKVDGSANPNKDPLKFSFGLPAKTPVETTTENKPVTSSVTTSESDKKSLNSGQTQAPSPSTAIFSTTSKKEESSKKEEKNEVKSINPLLKPGEKLPEKAAVAPAGFNFGLSKASSQLTAVVTPKPSELPSSDESPSKKTKQANEPVEPIKTPTFAFSTPAANGDTNKSLVFSKGADSHKPTSAPSGGFAFSFGSTPKTTSTVSSTTTNVTTFGSAATTTDASKAPAFKFNSGNLDAPKSTNGFSFSSTTPSFGSKNTAVSSTDSKTFIFGSAAHQPTVTTTATSTLGTTSSGSTFGTNALSKPPMFQFGAGTSDNKTQSSAPPPFPFNASNPDNKPATSQFSFGGSATTSAPTFGFGQSSTATPSFGFVSSAAPTTNHFSSTAKTETNAFGAGTSHTAANGLFNFGSAASMNQKAVFNFGSSAEANGPSGNTPAQTGFNFGSEQAKASTSSGGFNFTGPAPSFDANAKPVFNFSGGSSNVPTFSAPPTQEGTMPKRIIRKAIRRTVR